jgi:hypothetical protein
VVTRGKRKGEKKEKERRKKEEGEEKEKERKEEKQIKINFREIKRPPPDPRSKSPGSERRKETHND